MNMSERPRKQAQQVGEALREYERPLVSYALGITGNLEQARDVVQDTFLKLCNQDTAKLDGHLAQWLYTVCRNRALDVRKKEGRMQALDQRMAEAQAAPEPGPNGRAERREEHGIALEVIGSLPNPQQEAFRLKFEHGLTYREIGGILDMPLSTVSYTITQALATIRVRMRTKLGTEMDTIKDAMS